MPTASLPSWPMQSAWGLVPRGGGTDRSRLGGRADLPEDTAWPTSGGRALTHLATIDLSELPAFDGRDLLPADGDLVFFADLTQEGELWEEVVVGEDDRVRILHVPPGTPTHEPEPPRDDRDEYDSPAVLRRRRIAFRPVLTMPERPEGLDAAQQLAYDKLYGALLEVTPALEEPGHLLLGHPSVVQYDPRSPGQVSLLHVGHDEALGFEFLDGGDLTFYGDADDVPPAAGSACGSAPRAARTSAPRGPRTAERAPSPGPRSRAGSSRRSPCRSATWPARRTSGSC